MSACPVMFTCAPAYINFNRTFVEGNLLELFDKNRNFITTEKVNSLRTTLSEEIDDVYAECNKDGWANSKQDKSYAIKFRSTEQAKEFAKYVEDVEQPNVIPFMSGYIGFEWNISNKLISIMFKDNGDYIYSIITDSVNDYGENKQNTENQKALSSRILKILLEETV